MLLLDANCKAAQQQARARAFTHCRLPLFDDFDAKHTDAVTGYYFADRKQFLYLYMGYPKKAQGRTISPSNG